MARYDPRGSAKHAGSGRRKSEIFRNAQEWLR